MPKPGGGLASALALLAIVACGSETTPPKPVVTIQVGANPSAIAVAGGSAWVANSADGTLSRISLQSNHVESTIKISDPRVLRDQGCGAASIHQVPHGSFSIRNCDLPKAVAIGAGSLWVGDGGSKALVRLNANTGASQATIPVGIDPWYIAASASAVWATDFSRDTVVRVDPATNALVATIPEVPYGPTGIAIADDSVWVANSRADVVTRIDPATNKQIATVPVGHVPLPVVFAFGSAWVRNEFKEGNGTVSRIDPTTNRVVAEVPVGPEAGRDGLDGLAVADGSVWVAGLMLERIDPVRNQVVGRYNHTANAVTSGAESLWMVDVGYSVTRLQLPLTDR